MLAQEAEWLEQEQWPEHTEQEELARQEKVGGTAVE